METVPSTGRPLTIADRKTALDAVVGLLDELGIAYTVVRSTDPTTTDHEVDIVGTDVHIQVTAEGGYAEVASYALVVEQIRRFRYKMHPSRHIYSERALLVDDLIKALKPREVFTPGPALGHPSGTKWHVLACEHGELTVTRRPGIGNRTVRKAPAGLFADVANIHTSAASFPFKHHLIPTVHPDRVIRITPADGAEPATSTTWKQFLRDNDEPNAGLLDIVEIAYGLHEDGAAMIGGGAQPLYCVTFASPARPLAA